MNVYVFKTPENFVADMRAANAFQGGSETNFILRSCEVELHCNINGDLLSVTVQRKPFWLPEEVFVSFIGRPIEEKGEQTDGQNTTQRIEANRDFYVGDCDGNAVTGLSGESNGSTPERASADSI